MGEFLKRRIQESLDDQEADNKLSPWEIDFLESLLLRESDLTEKQVIKLEQIEEKLR